MDGYFVTNATQVVNEMILVNVENVVELVANNFTPLIN